jgi:hypothetical protein
MSDRDFRANPGAATAPVKCRLGFPRQALPPREIRALPGAKTQHLFRKVGRFRPDFPRPSADLVFVGPGQSTRPLFQFNDQGQNALDGLPIADPPSKVAVLICLGKKASDNLLLIHRALSV